MVMLLNKLFLSTFKMKPIKLRGMPENPCKECLVKVVCITPCEEKEKQVEWVRSRFYGHKLQDPCRRKMKNANILIKQYEEIRKFNVYRVSRTYSKYKI